MYSEDKNFYIRVSVEANFPDNYDGDEDGHFWLKEWEHTIRPQLMKTVLASLREHRAWTVRIRNRGVSQDDEIEIALVKEF